ncbi:MAG TPA: hypothetical protein VHA33_22715 [Candidatus Angelobacter sp.]|jgi:hypothetical protein|nr:hypothetical protein [Candidatus Angelobacter sp.]
MSSAIFTFLGIYTLIFHKSEHWLIVASFIAGALLSYLACFLTWKEERNKVSQLEMDIREMRDKAGVKLYISRLAHDGYGIFISAPCDDDDAIKRWIWRVGKWRGDTHSFLLSQSPLAADRFQETYLGDDIFFSPAWAHQDTLADLNMLRRKLLILREIIEKSDIYLVGH